MAWDATFDWENPDSFKGDAQTYLIISEIMTNLSIAMQRNFMVDKPRNYNLSVPGYDGTDFIHLTPELDLVNTTWDSKPDRAYTMSYGDLKKSLLSLDTEYDTFVKDGVERKFGATTNPVLPPTIDRLINTSYDQIADDGSLWTVAKVESYLGMSRPILSDGGVLTGEWISWIYKVINLMTRPFRFSDSFDGVLCASGSVGDAKFSKRYSGNSDGFSVSGGRITIAASSTYSTILHKRIDNNIWSTSSFSFFSGDVNAWANHPSRFVFKDVDATALSALPQYGTSYPSPDFMVTFSCPPTRIGYRPSINFDSYPGYHQGYDILLIQDIFVYYTIPYPESNNYLSGDWEVEVIADNHMVYRFNGVDVLTAYYTPNTNYSDSGPAPFLFVNKPVAEVSMGAFEAYNSRGILS